MQFVTRTSDVMVLLPVHETHGFRERLKFTPLVLGKESGVYVMGWYMPYTNGRMFLSIQPSDLVIYKYILLRINVGRYI